MQDIQSNKDLDDFIEASGLNEYDPDAIARIYRGHPQRLLRRLWQTLIPIGIYLFKIAIDKVFGLLKNKEKATDRAKQFTELLVELGPAFIKAGQALSTRPDIVPALLLDELSQLQDQLPGFDSKLAMDCIEEDLERSIDSIFESLDEEPISAASLGQVHKGVLKGGARVAVKIQRPGLREQITLDLFIVRNIARWLKENIGLIRSDLVALIDELGKRVFEEMDYLNEAENANKFARLHKRNTKIAVPKIYEEATSRRVLTMEWIDGVKLTNLKAVKNLGIDPQKMIDIGVNCSLKQLLEDGFFHADPHPGNLLALPDGRLCYLDFGMMSEVSRESRTGLIQSVVHLVNKNFKELSEDFVSLGFLENNINLAPIVPAFEKVFTNAIDMGVSKMDFKTVTDDLSGVMYKFPFKVPPYYALIIRSLITLEGIALSVDPNFKILGAAYPYFAKRLIEDPDPELRESLKEMLFDEGLFSWKKLEELLGSAAKQKDIDIGYLLDQILNFLFSKNGNILQEQLIEIIINQLDIIGLKTIGHINQILPKNIQSKRIKKRTESLTFIQINPINSIAKILKELPGYKSNLLLKTTLLIKEPIALKMGIKIAKGITEKNLDRIVRFTIGPSTQIS